MAFNPDFGLNMLQRQAAERAIKNGTDLPPQMIGDGTGVSDMHPAFLAAVRQEMTGKGREEQPEIAQRQAAPEAPQESSTAALMSGAADASRVAAMAHGGAVKGYADGGESYLEKTIRNARSANRGDFSFLDDRFKNRGYPRTDILSERLRTLAPPEMTQEEQQAQKEQIQFLQSQGLSLPLNTPLKERMRQKAEGAAYRESVEPMRALSEEIASKAGPGYTNPGGYGEFDPEFNAAESTLTKQPLEPLTSLQGFDPAKTSPVEYTPPDFQYGEAAVAAPRAKAAERAAQALTTPPPAIKPNEPDPAAEALNARKQEESNAHKERMDKLLGDDQPLSAQDKWMALARAGFASAAGSSPYALQNIGAGLSKGVESLDELRKERAVNRMKQATLLQSQRSEDLSNDARNRQLVISSRGVDIQGAREIREAEAERLAAPTRRALIEAQTANLIRPEKVSPLEQEINIQNKIDAMPDGKDKTRAQVVFDQSRTREVPQTSSFVIQQAIINAGEEAGKAFDKTFTVLEQVETDPVKKAETANKRQAAVEEAERRAAVRFNVSNSSTAAPSPAGGGIRGFSSLVE